MNELLTIEEVCKSLKLKQSRLRYLIFKSKIPYLKIGRSIRFTKVGIQSWLKKREAK